MPQFNDDQFFLYPRHIPGYPGSLWPKDADFYVNVISLVGAGPKGAKGDQGEPGPQGEKGEPGDGSAIAAEEAARIAAENAQIAQAEAQAASEAAEAASESAGAAAEAAASAISSAANAESGLSEVQKVLDTTNWIAEHGRYIKPSDPDYNYDFDPNQFYYTRTGSGTEEDPYVYTIVENPVEEDYEDYYILVVDESVQAYVASKLFLLDDGLYVRSDESSYKVRVGADGIDLLDENYNSILSATSDGIRVGDAEGLHAEVTNDRYAFVDGNGTTVAYFEVGSDGQSTLHVARTIITKESQFGDWKWYERPNGNMALRWIGEDEED